MAASAVSVAACHAMYCGLVPLDAESSRMPRPEDQRPAFPPSVNRFCLLEALPVFVVRNNRHKTGDHSSKYAYDGQCDWPPRDMSFERLFGIHDVDMHFIYDGDPMRERYSPNLELVSQVSPCQASYAK
jgi:hypothetical protein